MVKMEEERALQRLAVADDVDPEKEAARIREKHTQGMVCTVCLMIHVEHSRFTRNSSKAIEISIVT